ncbi:rubrerythrin-like domain-containing protein [Haloarcula montana]|nr:rubrerythrin-like domain-containing protein [Haloarcula sp. GH36]
MRDVKQDHDEETPYECFVCGKVIVAESHPENCRDCGGEMRNRQTPLE